MDRIAALNWLGIDQWALRSGVPAQEQPTLQASSSAKVTANPTVPEERAVRSELCFIAANGAEFSALVLAISACLPSGVRAVHQPAIHEQPPSVKWDGRSWSLAELRRNGQAKRELWRLLVGSNA